MKIIITGATGGLGRNLFEYLFEKQNEIIALGRNLEIGKLLHSQGAVFKACDLRYYNEVIESFQNADCVIHCAALSSPWGSYNDFFEHNVVATQNVIKASQEYKIPKIIFVSTSSVYFDFQDHLAITEDFIPKHFVNFYAYTKFLGEHIAINSPMHSCIIRPRGIFGEYDNVLLPRLERIAKKGFLPLVKGREHIRSDVTYAKNVAHAIYLAMTQDYRSGSIYNITNDEPLSILEIYQKISEILQYKIEFKTLPHKMLKTFASLNEFASKIGLIKEPLITQYALGLVSYSQTLEIKKAKNELKYEPIYSIQEGLKRYANFRNS